MTQLGHYSGPIDGIYGPATTAGVEAMQTALGVTADGIYGPETHAALKIKGKYIVVEMQIALTEYGYYTGPINGNYGAATIRAVKKLQTDLGVTADGRFGSETAKAFNDAVANGTLQPASAQSTQTVTGPAVAELQRVMARLGYYSGPIDGAYGSATMAGVETMQKALGVTADGIYGPETHTALKGQGNYIVVEIQTALAEYGYYTGPIDGAYGPATTDAVKKLQTDLGVSADGRFGPETAKAFNEAVASGKLKPV
jgi:peptidoglycan hydrolase-like protein with peptidoglycan-binding domain